MPIRETRDDRVAKLKRKFLSTGGARRIKEYVRYDRAAKGELAHSFPQEYVEDCRDAFEELLFEDYGKMDRLPELERFIEIVRGRPSRPFIPDPNKN